MENKKLFITTLGCTKNQVDSEVMIAELKNRENYILTDIETEADLIIINSCGFINSAKEESIEKTLQLAQAKKDGATLVLSGCLSERYKEELPNEMKNEVDIFTGVGDYHSIVDLIQKRENRFSNNAFLIANEERVITGSVSHAYIKIGEGCNQTCSFCAIPNFKGKLKSRTIENIVDEVKKLIQRGFYDFSFISQDSSSYLRDSGIKNGLELLIDEIEKIDGVVSARILYLYPSTTSMKLITKIAESKKFHNYFDMPIQHISDKMLKVMKRGLGRAGTEALLREMRSIPNSFIRTAFIIGHPQENRADFEEILKFIREFRFDIISVFAYSNEEGTSAFTMDQISEKEIERRMNRIEEVIEEQRIENLLKLVDSEIPVIINGESSESEYLLSGKAIYWGEDIDGEILINDREIEDIVFGKIYLCRITEFAGDYLMATVLNEI
jgi:ribosomal protein S12 methylthiotransferase RimO